jgi:hypothetical protein
VRRLASGFLIVVLLAPVWARAQQPSGAAHTHPPPELPGPIASALAPGGLSFTIGAAQLDFWFVRGLAVTEGAEPPGWSDVEEGALVGAVRMTADFRDVRGRVIKPGVYTLRYGIQPENGDHLGVSPYRDFLLLLPAALDTESAPRGHDGTIDLSKRTAGGSHPAVWSIDPPATPAALGTEHRNEELDLRSFTMEVPVLRAGKPAGAIRFGLVLVGKIEA